MAKPKEQEVEKILFNLHAESDADMEQKTLWSHTAFKNAIESIESLLKAERERCRKEIEKMKKELLKIDREKGISRGDILWEVEQAIKALDKQ